MADGSDARSDRALLADHAAGEPHAFEELVRRHRDRLWSFAVRTLDHREDAADAVQEALVSAFRSAAGYRGESEVSTWLHRIVLNACLDRIRRRRAWPIDAIADRDVPVPRDRVDEHLTRLTVVEALRTLPVGQRVPIVLIDMEGFSVAETAEILEVPEGTIKSRCARGRARLARALGHLRPAGSGHDEGNEVPAARVGTQGRGTARSDAPGPVPGPDARRTPDRGGRP